MRKKCKQIRRTFGSGWPRLMDCCGEIAASSVADICTAAYKILFDNVGCQGLATILSVAATVILLWKAWGGSRHA